MPAWMCFLWDKNEHFGWQNIIKYTEPRSIKNYFNAKTHTQTHFVFFFLLNEKSWKICKIVSHSLQNHPKKKILIWFVQIKIFCLIVVPYFLCENRELDQGYYFVICLLKCSVVKGTQSHRIFYFNWFLLWRKFNSQIIQLMLVVSKEPQHTHIWNKEFNFLMKLLTTGSHNNYF